MTDEYLTDRQVLGIIAHTKDLMRAHHASQAGEPCEAHCTMCRGIDDLLTTARQAMPAAAQIIDDARTEWLMRSGAGTDWRALQGTVFAR